MQIRLSVNASLLLQLLLLLLWLTSISFASAVVFLFLNGIDYYHQPIVKGFGYCITTSKEFSLQEHFFYHFLCKNEVHCVLEFCNKRYDIFFFVVLSTSLYLKFDYSLKKFILIRLNSENIIIYDKSNTEMYWKNILFPIVSQTSMVIELITDIIWNCK